MTWRRASGLIAVPPGPLHPVGGESGVRSRRESTPPLPPDIQADWRVWDLYDEQSELEALEHFEALRRESEERL